MLLSLFYLFVKCGDLTLSFPIFPNNIEPTSHVLSLSNVVRGDIPGYSIPVEDALMNAPDHTDKFYRVPKIIE
ncbi:MAG: aspartyl/glutamyl-tRNA amidotransferase subunit C [Nitrospira sp.]|nr:aspartyl/glutamyl-tRNA amidotransferase subunit C [Nitrospira sp.]